MSAVPLIAIVDDDDAGRASLGNLVRSAGYRARSFSSAEAFLRAAPHEAACLLLDVRMPGMSGLELQRQLIADQRCTPVIFVTARADESARSQALQAGALAFLSKPLCAEELLHVIDASLQGA